MRVDGGVGLLVLGEFVGQLDLAGVGARQPGLPLAVRHGGCRCVCDMMIDRVTPLGGAAAQSHRAVRGARWSGPMTRSDSALAGAGRNW